MSRKFWKGAALLSAGMVLAAAAYIGLYLYQSYQNAAFYETIMEQAQPQENEMSEQLPLLADLNALKARNPDCVGVLCIPDTPIDYPVVCSEKENGEYYLHRSFNEEKSAAGTLFLDHRCATELRPQHEIIYGHHMRNGQMFAVLKKYQEESFWREHPRILYQTEAGTEIYEIFSVFRMDPSSQGALSYLQAIETADTELGVQLNAFYDTGIVPAPEDAVLTLVTCDYAAKNGRMVITARCGTQQKNSGA